jgi:hypothetical protein
MTDPLQALLKPTALEATAFPPTSRYHGIATAGLKTDQDKTITYLRRRFIPQPERFALIQEHSVVQGDRPDNLANQYLGDPERFWLLCDANNVMDPNDLTETVGKRVRITLPEGIPSGGNV